MSLRKQRTFLPTNLLRTLIIIGASLVVVVALFFVLDNHQQATSASSRGPTTQNPFEKVTVKVPSSIEKVPIVNEQGQTTSLGSLSGRIVVLADTMTSCQEECPITTGALIAVYNSLSRQHLLRKVTILDLSVDPQRDVPARLLAYAKMTGVHFELATGTAADLKKIWNNFGVSYWKVKEGSPADIDWYTHKPYTYDIDHSDDVFVIDKNANVRYLVDGAANLSGKLSLPLQKLLDDQGKQNLAMPGQNSWTPNDLLASISSVLGTAIQLANS